MKMSRSLFGLLVMVWIFSGCQRPEPPGLHEAALYGDRGRVEELIHGGSNVNAHDEKGIVPLEYAAWGNRQTVELLIGHGGDVNAEDRLGYTPLHAAANRPDLALILISKGARIDCQRKDNLQTPLHLAVRDCQIQVVEILMKAGANASLRDRYGLSPFDYAKECSDRRLKELFKDRSEPTAGTEILTIESKETEAGKKPGYQSYADLRWAEIDFAAAHHYYGQLARYLPSQAEINAAGPYGWTLLHLTASKGYSHAAALLLAGGAEVDGRTEDGETALHKAVRGGHLAVVELLLEAGADVNARDRYGSTPLFLAVRNTQDVVDLLLKHGAEVEITNKVGFTPVFVANTFGRSQIAELLRRKIEGTVPSEPPSSLPLDYFQARRIADNDAIRHGHEPVDYEVFGTNHPYHYWFYYQKKQIPDMIGKLSEQTQFSICVSALTGEAVYYPGEPPILPVRVAGNP